ncbi:MAG: hypothetical protein AB7N70_01025 [Dehalococcoidia bacterium]
MADQVDFLDRLIGLLGEHEIRYCLIGGQAVNAYIEPLDSLDLDIVVAVEQLSEIEALLRDEFNVERFPHSLALTCAFKSKLTCDTPRLSTDPRCDRCSAFLCPSRSWKMYCRATFGPNPTTPDDRASGGKTYSTSNAS